MLNSPNYYIIQNLSLDSKQHIFICSNIFVAPFAHLCHIWAISKHTTTTQDKNLVKIIEEYLLLKLLCCFSATSSVLVWWWYFPQNFVILKYNHNKHEIKYFESIFTILLLIWPSGWYNCAGIKMRKKSKLIVPPRSRWKVSCCHG